jgi:hypothetical protein
MVMEFSQSDALAQGPEPGIRETWNNESRLVRAPDSRLRINQPVRSPGTNQCDIRGACHVGCQLETDTGTATMAGSSLSGIVSGCLADEWGARHPFLSACWQ